MNGTVNGDEKEQFWECLLQRGINATETCLPMLSIVYITRNNQHTLLSIIIFQFQFIWHFFLIFYIQKCSTHQLMIWSYKVFTTLSNFFFLHILDFDLMFSSIKLTCQPKLKYVVLFLLLTREEGYFPIF